MKSYQEILTKYPESIAKFVDRQDSSLLSGNRSHRRAVPWFDDKSDEEAR